MYTLTIQCTLICTLDLCNIDLQRYVYKNVKNFEKQKLCDISNDNSQIIHGFVAIVYFMSIETE